MQPLRDSDSSGDLIPISPSRGTKQTRNGHGPHGYSEEFQAMLERLDQEDASEETSVISEKKRRLNLDQVKALERSFELENKLEPGRKLKLAQELGLQPRQIAIWFQNRRARYKTKLLERDYGILKANYDALKLSYVNLEHERETLSLQLRDLKEKMRERIEGRKDMVKELVSNADNSKSSEYKSESHNVGGDSVKEGTGKLWIKEEGNVNSPPSSVSCSNSVMNSFQLPDSINVLGKSYYQSQVLRMEEQSLFCIDESCSFFAVDQAPTLQWSFQGE